MPSTFATVHVFSLDAGLAHVRLPLMHCSWVPVVPLTPQASAVMSALFAGEAPLLVGGSEKGALVVAGSQVVITVVG
jgi:hypothetical protein